VTNVAGSGVPRSVPGPVRFARYAYPPNALGYCGSEDSLGLLEYAAAGIADGGLRALAERFDGAWPYLTLIAGANGIPDPLDAAVVEAYWIGNSLLDRVDPMVFARFLDEGVGRRTGPDRGGLVAGAIGGGVPHHNFHVFAVYPWVGLLRAGRVAEPLGVLEKCRIRWGDVVDIEGDRALVSSRPLRWDGRRLTLGPSRVEAVHSSSGGRRLAAWIRPGDSVALHWHWICDRLTAGHAGALRRYTMRTLAVINRLDRSPVRALG
jgi:hypothetical protein